MPPNPHPLPTKNFDRVQLPISKIDNQTYYRLNPVNYTSAIYFDRSGRGRYDSPSVAYGICYLGESLEAAFIECFGRQLGVRFLSQEFIKTRNLFTIKSNKPLTLVDLFGSGLSKIGADSRLTGGNNYQLSRSWAEAIYHHPQQVDGIRYYSRHDNTQLCCGLFERNSQWFTEQNQGNLVDADSFGLAEILKRYDYGIY